MKPLRCAIYVRVSTRDKGQTVENQLPTLRTFARDAIIAILGTIAQQESRRISERVTAGVARVREATGKHWGRLPAVSDLNEFRADVDAGLTVDQLATRYSISRSLVYSLRSKLRRVPEVAA